MSEEEEFEFRARAEAEQALAQKQQAAQQPQPGVAPGTGPVAPGMLDQAGNFITQTAIPTAYGVGAAAADVAASHPYMTAGAAAMLPNNILNKIPGGQKIAAGKEFFNNLGRAAEAYAQKEARLQNRPGFGGAGAGANPGVTASAQAGAQQAAQQTARQSMAERVRQMAAQRIMPVMAGAAVPAAVGAAVAAPGAAMMMDAYRNYQRQTPEERRRSAMEALSGQGQGQAGIY